MPIAYPCKFGICRDLVTRRGSYCAEHESIGRAERAERDMAYDRYRRDKASRQFYASAAWNRARVAKLANNPVCEYAGCIRFAQHVHHRVPLNRCTVAQRLDQANLESLCLPHHNSREAEDGGQAA